MPLFPPIPVLEMCSAWASKIHRAWPCEGSSGIGGGRKGKQWELGILPISNFKVSRTQLLVPCLLAVTCVSTSGRVDDIIKKILSEGGVEVMSPLLL